MLCDAIQWNTADDYGEFKTWGNHSDFWDKLSRDDSMLKEMEYFDCPRGRVTYNTDEDLYYLYLNKRINNEAVIELVIEKYNLFDCNVRIDDSDEHYQFV